MVVPILLQGWRGLPLSHLLAQEAVLGLLLNSLHYKNYCNKAAFLASALYLMLLDLLELQTLIDQSVLPSLPAMLVKVASSLHVVLLVGEASLLGAAMLVMW